MRTVTINNKQFELNDQEEKIFDMFQVISSDSLTKDKAEQIIVDKIKANAYDITSDPAYIELKEAFEVQGMALKAIQQRNSEAPKTIAQQYKDAITGRKEAWERFKSGRDSSFAVELKAAGTWLISTNIAGETEYLPMPQFIPGVTPIIANSPDIIPLCNVSTSTSPVIVWVEKKNPDGTVVATDEGGLKPLLDFDYDVNTSTAYKYPGKIKVSTEALEDIPFMANEIDTELRRAVELAADSAVMTYITTKASAYSLTSIATLMPNVADAIRAAVAQVKSLNHMATIAVLNPIDAANMDIQKSDDGSYALPPFTTADGTTVKGVRVVESNQIEAGFVLVGDMSKVRVFIHKPFTVTMGWVDDDFEKNLVTMIGETRLHYYIEDAYTTALVYDSIGDIKTAIELV